MLAKWHIFHWPGGRWSTKEPDAVAEMRQQFWMIGCDEDDVAVHHTIGGVKKHRSAQPCKLTVSTGAANPTHKEL